MFMEWTVWQYQGEEVNAYKDRAVAEAHIRRALHAGWNGHDYMFDSDGSLLFVGLNTGHKLTTEMRSKYGI